MNIAILHYSAPPIVGGVETVIARQAKQLTRAGHQVRIIAGRGETWTAQIPVITFPQMDFRHPSVLKVHASLDEGKVPDEFNPLVQRIGRDLRRALEGIDIVFVHNFASLNKNLALTTAVYQFAKTSQDMKFILFHHELAWSLPKYRGELFPDWPWNLLRTPWPNSTQVATSEPQKRVLNKLMGIPSESIVVIPDGLDMLDFLGLNLRSISLLEKIPLSKAAPILLCPVRITRRKNLGLAISTLCALKEKMPEAVLVITGPSGTHSPYNVEYLKKLKKLRKKLNLDKSVFLMAEYVPEGMPAVCVADFYRVSDAVLITSKEEAVGMPILEAGLARLPIFCTDLKPLRDLAGDWATYFSPKDKPAEIAKLIARKLKKDPVYRLRVHVRREFTWKAIYQSKIEPLLR